MGNAAGSTLSRSAGGLQAGSQTAQFHIIVLTAAMQCNVCCNVLLLWYL